MKIDVLKRCKRLVRDRLNGRSIRRDEDLQFRYKVEQFYRNHGHNDPGYTSWFAENRPRFNAFYICCKPVTENLLECAQRMPAEHLNVFGRNIQSTLGPLLQEIQSLQCEVEKLKGQINEISRHRQKTVE